MDGKGRNLKNKNMDDTNIEDEMDLRRGPWTVEEDFKLINYIATHGEGRWNSLARCAGLKRTGKSCRLRWLNYLRPDVRRGNITLEEQLLILDLHSRWGNRWSKIAQYLPGRTDNEIKNYWRTRVQKHAKQLKCDVNSKQFKDTMRYLWMPRLVERIQAAAAANASSGTAAAPSCITTSSDQFMAYDNGNNNNIDNDFVQYSGVVNNNDNPNCYTTPENSSVAVSPASDLTEYYSVPMNDANPNPTPNPDYYPGGVMGQIGNNYSAENNMVGPHMLPDNYFNNYNGLIDEDLQAMQGQSNLWLETGGSYSDSLWNNFDVDQDFWLLPQFNNNKGSF